MLVGGVARSVTTAAVVGSTSELTLASPVTNGQTVTVAYTDPTAGNDASAIQDAACNDAVTLAATATTNNVPVPPPFVSVSNGTGLAQVIPGSGVDLPPLQGDTLSLNTGTLADVNGLGVLSF